MCDLPHHTLGDSASIGSSSVLWAALDRFTCAGDSASGWSIWPRIHLFFCSILLLTHKQGLAGVKSPMEPLHSPAPSLLMNRGRPTICSASDTASTRFCVRIFFGGSALFQCQVSIRSVCSHRHSSSCSSTSRSKAVVCRVFSVL
jgi:hypothetical protein